MNKIRAYRCSHCGTLIYEYRVRLSRKYIQNFIKLCDIDKPMTAKDIKEYLNIDNVYLTDLRRFNLLYKDARTKRWSVTEFGHRFRNMEIPCPYIIIVRNKDVINEERPAYLCDFLSRYNIHIDRKD